MKWSRGAAAAAALTLISACGSSGDGGQRPADRPKQPATELSASFRDRALVATNRYVVDTGPELQDQPSPRFTAFDLKSGDTTAMDPAPAEAGFQFNQLAVVGLADEVLVGGRRCPLPYDQEECAADAYRFHLLDPATGRWRTTTMPESVDALGPTSIAMVQPLPGGGAVADLWVDGNSQSVIVVLEGDQWRQVAAPRPSTYGTQCATSTDLYDFGTTPVQPTAEDLAASKDTVAFKVTALSLATGEVRELGSPPVDGSYGGIGVEASCGSTQVAVASKGPVPDGPGQMFVLDRDQWADTPGVFDDLGPILPIEAWSGAPTPVIGVQLLSDPGAPTPGSPLVLATLGATGQPGLATDPVELRNRDLLQLGPTASFLVLGPSMPATEIDQSPEAGRPIPIEMLTVA